MIVIHHTRGSQISINVLRALWLVYLQPDSILLIIGFFFVGSFLAVDFPMGWELFGAAWVTLQVFLLVHYFGAKCERSGQELMIKNGTFSQVEIYDLREVLLDGGDFRSLKLPYSMVPQHLYATCIFIVSKEEGRRPIVSSIVPGEKMRTEFWSDISPRVSRSCDAFRNYVYRT